MAERLTLPAAIPLELPVELVGLEYIELRQLVQVETMWGNPATGGRYVGIVPEWHDDELIAKRNRYAIGGRALGAHPELGAVEHEDGITVTRLFVVIAYTPWITP